jgi:5-methylthioadenosine/S-adenosylhomocysteine deaminase
MHACLHYRPEDMYAAQLQGGLEALNAGVTTTADYCHNLLSEDHASEAIRGLRESGIRAVWSYGFNYPPLPTLPFKSFDERLAHFQRLAASEFSSRDQLVTLGVAPAELPLWESEDQGVAQFRAARECAARLIWHCNGTTMGVPPSEIAHLHRLGLLADDIVFAHMHFTTPDEWKLLQDVGAQIAFTPDTELQMGMDWPSTNVAIEHGLTPSYGADIVSNNSADLLIQLRMALQIARAQANEHWGGQFYDGVTLKCADALAWGTINGARALGLDSITGSLTPGKDADLIMVETNSLSMVGWDKGNPEGSIILQSSVADIDTVMVRGKMVKQRGRMLADTGRAISLLRASADHIARGVGGPGGFYVSPAETFQRIGISDDWAAAAH